MHRTSVNIGLTTLIIIQWRPLVWTETVMSLCWKQNTSSFNVHHVALSLLYYLHCIELLCKSINKTKDGIIIYPNNTTTADTPAFHSSKYKHRVCVCLFKQTKLQNKPLVFLQIGTFSNDLQTALHVFTFNYAILLANMISEGLCHDCEENC